MLQYVQYVWHISGAVSKIELNHRFLVHCKCTFHSWASLWVANLVFQVPSYCRAISTSIEWLRVVAISGSYLIASTTGYWAGRPLSPFIVSSGNCKTHSLRCVNHGHQPVTPKYTKGIKQV